MTVKIKRQGAKPMAESEAHKKWVKENTVVVKARLQKSTDADILTYLQDKAPATEIKKALRLLIEKQKSAE